MKKGREFKEKRSAKEKNQKGQVTIFIILGIVILLAVVALVYMFTLYKESSVPTIAPGSSEIQKVDDTLNFNFQSCIQDIATREIHASLKKGGLVNDLFPVNNVVYNDKTYVASFDRDNPTLVLYIGKTYADQLPSRLRTLAENCVNPLKNEELVNQYNVNVIVDSIYAEATDDAVLLDYKYTFFIDNISKIHTLSQRVDTPMFKIFNQANIITDAFLKSYNAPDRSLNFQVCNSLYTKYGTKPQYPVDFVQKVVDNSNVSSILLRNDSFIINLNMEGEDFSFGVKPVLVPSIC